MKILTPLERLVGNNNSDCYSGPKFSCKTQNHYLPDELDEAEWDTQCEDVPQPRITAIFLDEMDDYDELED